MQISRTYLLFVVVIASGSQPSITAAENCSSENLENSVVYEGVTTSLPKLINGQWQVIPASAVLNNIMNITYSDDDNITTKFSSTYVASPSNLTILKSTLGPEGSMNQSTAGLYILKDLDDPNCTMAANLIVIRNGPVCACNATNPNAVTLSCSVIFAESQKQPNNPIFTWIRSNGVRVKQQQPLPQAIKPYSRRSVSQLSISSNDTTTYECQMTFSSTPRAPFKFMNLKAPSFNASCSVSCV